MTPTTTPQHPPPETDVVWDQIGDDHFVVTCIHTTHGPLGSRTETITRTVTTREAAEAMADTLRSRFGGSST